MNYCFNLEVGAPNPQSGQVVKSVNDSPRRFECEKCQKTFRRREHQLRHVSTQHKGEKPHACTVVDCKKRYTRREELLKHVRLHHETKKHQSHRSPEGDQRVSRKRVLLPRLSMSAAVAAQEFASETHESSAALMAKSTGITISQTSLPLASTAGFVRDSGPNQDKSKVGVLRLDLDPVVDFPLPPISASCWSVPQTGPHITTGELLDTPRNMSAITSASRFSQMPPLRSSAHAPLSSMETPFGLSHIPFTTPDRSISIPEAHELYPPTPISARNHDSITASMTLQTTVSCAPISPPSRRLPISSLLHSRGSSIESIFNGSSRDLPLPQPP